MPTVFARVWETLRYNQRLLGRHLRHGRASFSARPTPAKTAELAALFRGVNGWLRELGCGHALAYGTLLGWHREGRLLPHDRDVDFCAPVSAYPAILAAAGRLPAGFRLHDSSHRHPGPKLFVDYRGWMADIYFFDAEAVEPRFLIHSSLQGDIRPFRREWLLPFQPAELLGEATWVPARPLTMLTHHYQYIGPDAVQDRATGYFRPRGS